MSKDQFDNVYNTLKKKYKLINESGNFACFESGNSFVCVGVFKPKIRVMYETQKYKKALDEYSKKESNKN